MFTQWFDRYNELNIASGILGLGNMCKFKKLNQYLKHTLDYAFSHCKHPRIHIYGPCVQVIIYANRLAKNYNIEFSADSTAWTRAVTTKLKKKHGISGRKETLPKYFSAFQKRLKIGGVELK
jgi:hypothetical protein